MLKAIRALRQDFIDLELLVARGASARIVERPGCWMDAKALGQLVTDIRTVAAKTVPNETLDYGVLTGSTDRLENSILTIIYDSETKQPVAFNALVAMDVDIHGTAETVMHLGLVMVDQDVRSKGFSWALYGLTCLLLFVRGQMRPLWLSNVTQVPAIVGMVSKSFSDVYPTPDADAHRSFEHLLIARQIMSKHRHVFGVGADAAFDEERFVITDAYTGGSDNLKKTFEESQQHRDAIHNAFCKDQLDYQRGDDFLQLARLDLTAASQFITRNVPRRSFPAVVATLTMLSLNRLVLPLLYWFSADRQWGILRPASSRFRGISQ